MTKEIQFPPINWAEVTRKINAILSEPTIQRMVQPSAVVYERSTLKTFCLADHN